MAPVRRQADFDADYANGSALQDFVMHVWPGAFTICVPRSLHCSFSVLFARDAFRTASHGFLDTAHLRSLLARKKGGDAAAVKMNPLNRVHASFSCFKQAAPAEAQAILSKTQAYDFCMQLFNGALPL